MGIPAELWTDDLRAAVAAIQAGAADKDTLAKLVAELGPPPDKFTWTTAATDLELSEVNGFVAVLLRNETTRTWSWTDDVGADGVRPEAEQWLRKVTAAAADAQAAATAAAEAAAAEQAARDAAAAASTEFHGK